MMRRFYFSRDSSALACHILLEEIAAPYEACEISLAKGDQHDPAFRAVNPKGRVPALVTDQGVLTENPAILTYLAECHPDLRLLPDGAFARAKAQALNAFLCATMHVHFAHFKRAPRWVDDPAAQDLLRAKVPENLRACADLLEDGMIDAPFAMGARYTICDAYLFLAHRWMTKHGIDLADYPRIKAHRDHIAPRPATHRAMAAHGLEAELAESASRLP